MSIIRPKLSEKAAVKEATRLFNQHQSMKLLFEDAISLGDCELSLAYLKSMLSITDRIGALRECFVSDGRSES